MCVVRFLFVYQSEMDKFAHIAFIKTREEAEDLADKFRQSCSGYPCGIVTCAIFEVEVNV